MTRCSALLSALVVLLACDPGFSVVVTRPIAQPVERLCAAAALQTDSTFAVIDTVAKPWLAGDTSSSLGSFRWYVEDKTYPEHGELFQLVGNGADTLVAAFGRLGVARAPDVRRAETELSARVNAIADQCSRPLAPARCEYRASGRHAVACTDAG